MGLAQKELVWRDFIAQPLGSRLESTPSMAGMKIEYHAGAVERRSVELIRAAATK
jgi:hypothetical protein